MVVVNIGAKKLTDSEIKAIIKLKEEGYNTVEIAKIIGRSDSAVGKTLIKYGYKNNGNKIELTEYEKDLIEKEYTKNLKNSIEIWNEHFKNKCASKYIELYIKKSGLSRGQGRGNISKSNRHDYFNVIDTENKAYILGYITADGSITKKNIRLECSERDDEIIKFIISEINPETKIYKYIKNDNQCFSYAYIGSIDNVSDLEKYNVIKNKQCANLPLVYLGDEFTRHFIRGYFDGDGCVYNKSGKPSISICADTLFANQLKAILKLNGIKSYVIDMKKYGSNICNVRIDGLSNTKKFFDFIYAESGFCLYRKYDKFKTLLNENNM